MQVSLRLGEHGWTELDVWLGEKHHGFLLTHTFNSPLEELATALRALLGGASEISFTLHEEPGRYDWKLTAAPQNQNVLQGLILEYANNFKESESPVAVTEFEVQRHFFIDTFLAELSKIAMQLGYPAFAKDRDPKEFPWATWREIRRIRTRSESGGGGRIAPATPPTPPGMRVRTGRFQSD